ncbi:hypothetical protein JK202_16155 [Gluconobacter sp. Dm-62]|uniref:hypothetical protein n=1 Tax=Gluconobacter sp. Dm-62 TaxID=2799804 RepID=UPI001B8CED7C|nr:hypothetical protein [Gluconobacter sp. Dm-62]MBS1104493.1 hypothetical protein [Gluconobacter sp. Dm-62]
MRRFFRLATLANLLHINGNLAAKGKNMYIMDYKGKILHSRNNGEFYSKNINDINKDEAVIINDLEIKKITDLDADDIFIYDREVLCNRLISIGIHSDVKITYDKNSCTYLFSNKENKYLCSDNELIDFNKIHAYTWERFILIDEYKIHKINYIMSNSWVSKRDGNIYTPKDIKLKDIFSLCIGPINIDISKCREEDFGEYKFVGIVDNWSPEVFLLYCPHIYITAYSSANVLKQLALCVSSIRKFGKFNGRITVMTDQAIETIRDICDDESIDIDFMQPKDFVGFVCSKYSIINKDIYKHSQPLLYIDPDIIFDRPISPLFLDAVLSETICAPLETFNRLMTHPPIGSSLIQLDQLNVNIYSSGVNGGTISFPNIDDEKTREFVRLVRRTIANIGWKFGRKYNGWADQEVLNYISYKFGGINSSVFTKYANYVMGSMEDIYSRRGFVHFVGRSSTEKVVEMQNYTSLLALQFRSSEGSESMGNHDSERDEWIGVG